MVVMVIVRVVFLSNGRDVQVLAGWFIFVVSSGLVLLVLLLVHVVAFRLVPIGSAKCCYQINQFGTNQLSQEAL